MGTRQTISTTPIATTDVLFRAWGLAHSTALAAAGLVQTADTGQINWTTVVKPAASTKAGYEIWRFADTLQASAPIFLKIEYGIGAPVAASSCAIWVTIGTTTNGSGTLGGVTQALDVPPPVTNASNSHAAGVSPSYICHPAGGGSLVMACNVNQSGAPLAYLPSAVLVIDRTRDVNGAATGVGATAWWVRASTSAFLYVSIYGFNFSAPGVTAASVPIAAAPDATSQSPASSLLLSRHYGRLPQVYAHAAVLTYLNAEAVALTELDVVPFGITSRHYLALGLTTQNAASNQSNAVGANAATVNEVPACLAVVWEN